jgi:serine protease
MIKNTLRLSVVLFLFLVSCAKEDALQGNNPVGIESQHEPLTSKEINKEIDEAIRTKGSFDWSNASDYLLWSAVVRGQYVVTIGFGNSKNDFERSKSARINTIQNELQEIILKHEGKNIREALISSDTYLNFIDVTITKLETIIALRKNKQIRYIEPADYRYFENKKLENRSASSSSSGCGFESSLLNALDYTTITPNAKVPWAFYLHNIPGAWNYSTGKGITIGIIDTGVSPNQTLLGSNFNDGVSIDRTIQKYGVYVDSVWPWASGTDGPNDQCGHGTSMASVAASPRNDNGLPVGVAYNANLVTYRAASNVVLDGYHEQNGVKNAFTALGNNSDVKIISMSMGHIFSVGKIEDGIKYAYSKGKLIFCAGGTSTSFTTFVGVIFPAWMPETIAVTGVKEGASYQKCDVCHTGAKIDFTVVMQRAGSGNTVPVGSYYDNQTDYVGGSSVATAVTAGIAALVWAKNPSWTRDQVLAKMRQSASFYPNKNPDFGYGNINALLAVQ